MKIELFESPSGFTSSVSKVVEGNDVIKLYMGQFPFPFGGAHKAKGL